MATRHRASFGQWAEVAAGVPLNYRTSTMLLLYYYYCIIVLLYYCITGTSRWGGH